MQLEKSETMGECVKRALIVLSSLPNGPEITVALLGTWEAVLEEHGVKAAEVLPAIRRILGKAKWFPTPADVIECAKANRADLQSIEIDKRQALGMSQEAIDRQWEEVRAYARQRRAESGEPSASPASKRSNRRGGVIPPLVDCIITEDDLRRKDQMVQAMRGAK